MAEVSAFDGDIGSRTGSILVSWFLFNPNGPMAFAFGYMEEGERLRFFGRRMHFTGAETYLLDDLSQSEAASADFAERIFGAVVALNNHIAMSGDEPRPVPGADRLPDFVMTNGNPRIDHCLRTLLSFSPAVHRTDWGRELYYLKKYGFDLFERAGEEARESYEALVRESEAGTGPDDDHLKLIWHRHAHIESFWNWRPGAYRSQQHSEVAFSEWWSAISDPDFARRALPLFADAWKASIRIIEGGKLHDMLCREGRFTAFEDVVSLFDQFHLPLLPPD